MTIEDELHSLLMATAGEPTGSLHSALGRWRQRIGKLVAQAINNSGGAAGRLFSQVGYVATEAGPPPNGPGQPGLTSGSDLIFNDAPYGALPYSTNILGAFTLEAGKSYRLTGNIQLGYSDPTAFATIYWVDGANNILRNGVGDMQNSAYDEATGSYSGFATPDLLYTNATGAPQEVKLRVIEVTSGTVDILYGSNALVHEI